MGERAQSLCFCLEGAQRPQLLMGDGGKTVRGCLLGTSADSSYMSQGGWDAGAGMSSGLVCSPCCHPAAQPSRGWPRVLARHAGVTVWWLGSAVGHL